jgi:uncharacterized membrane protein
MARGFSYYLKTGRIISKLWPPFLRSERAQTSQLFRAVLWLAVTWIARHGDHQGRALHVILVTKNRVEINILYLVKMTRVPKPGAFEYFPGRDVLPVLMIR